MRLNPPTLSPRYGGCTVIPSDRQHFAHQHYSSTNTDIVSNFSGSAIQRSAISQLGPYFGEGVGAEIWERLMGLRDLKGGDSNADCLEFLELPRYLNRTSVCVDVLGSFAVRTWYTIDQEDLSQTYKVNIRLC
jgi:hypothetical protein